jgi:dUTP pyrophosphatase
MSVYEPLVYLAHPIDLYSRIDSRHDLVVKSIGLAKKAGLPVYHPGAALHVAGTPSSVVNRVNEGALRTATGVLAFLPTEARSIGVPAEISDALAQGKPVALITDANAQSWYLAGWEANPLFRSFDAVESSVEQAVEWLAHKMKWNHATEADVDTEVEPVIFGRVDPDAILPTRGYATDAGFDLYVSESVTVPAHGFTDVPCGVSVDLPAGTWGLITGRSSTLRTRRLLVAQGVIDESYTGPLYAGCENLTGEDVEVKQGERIAQLILHYAPGQGYTPSWGTPRPKERGDRGFGSTGR